MKIPLVDLKAQYRSIREEIDSTIQSVLDDTAFVSGPYAKSFEDNFSKACGASYCVGVGNGTDALYIALRAAGVGAGHEVLVPANSFVATSEAVTMAGADVVFVDIDPDTYNIDPAAIEPCLTEKSRAVVAVHLFGQCADLDRLRDLCTEHDLILVQDCAQAHLVTWDDKPCIEFSDLLTFSFYPGKNLGAYGDAGAVVTNSEDLARHVRMIANHGRISKYDHEFEGVNSRLDGMQGAILDVKLRHLPSWTESRKAVAAQYDELLEGVPLELPKTAARADHVYHLYVVRTDRRDALREHLAERGIGAGVHYPIALPNLTAYQDLGHHPQDFPVASRYQNEVLSLPIFPEMTADQIKRVASTVVEFFESEEDVS